MKEIEQDEKVVENSGNVIEDEGNADNKQTEKPEKPPVVSEEVEIEMPKSDEFAGTPEERIIFGQKVIAGFNKQKTLIDKIYYYITYRTYVSLRDANIDNDVPNGTITVRSDLSEAEKQKQIKAAQDKMNRLADRRAALGFGRTNNTSPEDANTDKTMETLFLSTILGDGSKKALMESMKVIALISEWNSFKAGKDYNETLKKMPKDTTQKEKKALGLNYYDSYNINTLYSGAIADLNFNLRGNIGNLAEDDENGLGDFIFKSLNFNRYMKVSVFMTKLGLDADEKKRFLDEYGFDENESVYDAFKRNLTEELGHEPTKEEILGTVKNVYIKDLTNSVLDQSTGQPYLYFNSHFYDGMTIGYYMNIMKYNSDEKELFLKQYNIKSTDLVMDAFAAILEKDQVYKDGIYEKKKDEIINNKLINGDKNPVMTEEEEKLARQILPKDVETYAKDIIQRETDRNNYNGYHYRETATIEKYLCTIGYSKSERDDFYKARKIKAEDKVKDVFRAEMLKEMKPESADNLTDDDVYIRAQRFMESEMTRLKALGRGQESINIGFEVRNDLRDALKNQDDKDTYYAGIRILAGEDFNLKSLKPKDNPTKQADIDYKNFIEGEGKHMLEAAEDATLTANVAALKAIITGEKELKLHDDKIIQQYNDATVINTNPLFIRGAIAELEATKKGSKNTEKYDDMLQALKDYETLLISADQTGLRAAQEKVIEKCVNYVLHRKSKRGSDYGEKRFEVASTVLYTIMPKEEFDRWAADVNSHRDAKDRLTYGKCSLRQQRYFQKQEQKEYEALEATKYIKTAMPLKYEKQLERFEKFVAMKPEFDDKFDGVFLRDEYAEKIKPVDDRVKLTSVGYLDRINISDKDFAAIVFGGIHTQEATAADPRLKDYPDQKALLIGKDYTTELVKENPSYLNQSIDVITKGRESAINALNEYAAGNKIYLANLIVSGVRYAAAAGRNLGKLDDSLYMNSEMGRRLIDMLDRDSELKRLTQVVAVENFDTDIEFIKGMNALSSMYQKAQAADDYISKISKAEKINEKDYSVQTKEELVTDILLTKLIEDSNIKSKEKRKGETSYKKQEAEAVKKYNSNKMKLAKAGIGLGPEQNANDDAGQMMNMNADEYQKQGKAIEDELKLNKLIIADRHRYNPLISTLGNQKSDDALRESVRKIVKDSGITKKPMKTIIEDLKNPKIVNKIAALSQQTRTKRAEELTERRRAEAAARQKAANNHKPVL